MRTTEDLHQLQALPLNLKVSLTKQRIRQWIDAYGETGVYISFSGGKDSTVLLHIVREEYPNVPAVFCDTGLEYPEIREFVRKFDNVEWVKPEMNFKQVINKYGYPMFSKEVCETVYGARRWIKALEEKTRGSLTGVWGAADIFDVERRSEKSELYEQMKTGAIPEPIRVQMLNGTFKDKDGKPSRYNKTKYRFMLKAPFEISNICCRIMKKNPARKYAKQTGKMPMTAQMASESKLRTQKWLEHGCNGFDISHPISNPMAFWTEQDVLMYIKKNNIEICSVYGDIVVDGDDQMSIEDWLTDDAELFDLGKKPLKCTGADRTGCMFCGFGCHLEPQPGRFVRMKQTHPKQYNYIMKPAEEGGLGFKDVIDWINENGNMDIKY